MNDETVHQLCKQAVSQVILSSPMKFIQNLASFKLFTLELYQELPKVSIASTITIYFVVII